MRLLFDQNLSRRLVSRLADIYPESSHVALIGMDRASDEAVWEYARTKGYVIVTKDADFIDWSVLRGSPPKVIWLRLGNCTTSQAEAAIREHQQDIKSFLADSAFGILALH